MTIEIIDTTVTLGEIIEEVIGTIDLGNVNITMAGIDPSTVYTKEQTDNLLLTKEPIINPKKSAFNVDFGNTIDTACVGNDVRLSDSRTPLTHNQGIDTITGLQTALDGKANDADIIRNLNDLTEKEYSNLDNIPSTFTPSAHNQGINTITGLELALVDKANVADIPTDFNNLYNTKAEITDFLADKQDKLISSVNLKTINNESLLGAGNLVIGGGGGTTDHATLTNRNIADQHPMNAITGLDTALSNKEPLKGIDDNYVTDHDIIKLSNLSGVNTGDQDLSGYSLTNHNHNLANLTEKSYNSLDDLPTIPIVTNDFTDAYKTKLDGIAIGAEANVNTDWNATTGDAQLLNKPTSFPPSTHYQDINTINGLEAALNNKQTTIGYTTENIANKENSTISTDTTKYPTVNLLKTGLDLKENSIGTKKTAFNVDFGTTDSTACQGNDSRLSDSRTPLTHNQPETTIDFTDITTNDASITKHGFLPKLPNDSAKFLNGVGTWANAGGGGETVNYEALTADKVLTATDATIQVLTCTANRTVTLPTIGLSIGQKFEIWNNNGNSSSYYLTVNPSTLDKIYAQRRVIYRWDGTVWGFDNKDNVASGYNANGSSSGVANGYYSNGSSSGVANGYNANGSSYGVANGYNANGSSYGVANGHSANGSSSGVANGYSANGSGYGVANGVAANGSGYGVANGSNTTTNSKGKNTVAEGAYSKAERNREFVSTATEAIGNKAQLTIQKYMEKNLATSSGAWQELFIDGTSARLTIIASSVYNFKAQINAIDVTNFNVKCWEITGTIKRNGANVTSLVGTPTKTVIGADTATTNWDAQITADDTNESLKVEVKHDSTNNVRFSLNIFATETRV